MDIVINILEVLIVYFLLSHVLISEKKDLTKQLGGILIVIVVMSSLNLLEVSTTLTAIVMIFTYAMFAFLCFEGNRFQKIFWGASYLLIASIGDRVTFYIAALLDYENLNLLLEPGWDRFQMSLLYLFICFIMVLIVSRTKRAKLMLPRKFEFFILLVMSLGITSLDKLMSSIIFIDGTAVDSPYFFNKTNFIYLLILFFLIAIWSLVEYLAAIYQEHHDLQDKQRMEEYKLKEYQTAKNSLFSLQSWKHDYENQLLILHNLSMRNMISELKEYINDLSRPKKAHFPMADTGNAVLDSLLSSKESKAKDLNIQMKCSICCAEQLPFKYADLVSVLANLLDNAIEACQYVPPPRQRFITLVIKPYKRLMLIEVENSSDGLYNVKDKSLISRKQGEGHGIGLKRVKQLVKETGGCEHYETKPDSFKYTLMLPIHEEKYIQGENNEKN